MNLLIVGVVLFSVAHFVPAVATGFRSGLVNSLGEYGFKALLGLFMLAAVVLMVMGWKGASEAMLYQAPAWGDKATLLSMLIVSALFFAPYIENNIRRRIRHPQLVGVILFGVGHLLASGSTRGVVLFGGFTLWAIIEIVLLNRRDGAWERPAAVGHKGDFKLLLTGLGFFLIFLFTHENLFGVSPVPG